jgi:hypothetical protein
LLLLLSYIFFGGEELREHAIICHTIKVKFVSYAGILMNKEQRQNLASQILLISVLQMTSNSIDASYDTPGKITEADERK